MKVLATWQVGVLSTGLMMVGLLFTLMLYWLLFAVVASFGLILWISYIFGARLKDIQIVSVIYLSMSTSTILFLGGFIKIRNPDMVSFTLALLIAVFTSLIIIDTTKRYSWRLANQ